MNSRRQAKGLQSAMFGFLLGLVCLTVSAQTPPPKPAPTPKPPAAPERKGDLTGRVVDAEGRALMGARVFALKNGRRDGAAPGVMTGLDGRFRFKDLAASVYRLTANAPGFVPPADEPARNEQRYRLGDDATLRLVKGGVITGKVTNGRGEPLVNIRLRALLISEETVFTNFGETDDRGVYRLYGLRAGRYVVAVGGTTGSFGEPTGAEAFLIVYYPATVTRDTATVISVNTGEEISGIDISYEGAPGRVVSGKLLVSESANQSYNISLTSWPDGASGYYGNASGPEANEKPFDIKGLPDGEYLLTAQTNNFTGGAVSAATRRVTVKGADVTGLELTLTPLASVTGRVANDKAGWPSQCQDKPALAWEEIGLTLRRYYANRDEEKTREPFTRAETVVDTRGDFSAFNLSGGKYLLQWQLPSEEWYVRGVALPNPKTSAKAVAPMSAASAQLITLVAGAESKGLTLTLAAGAAGLRGRVMAAQKDATGQRVYLVPVERENADNTLRYAETEVASDGAFVLKNLAPGRYWLLARPASQEKTPVSLFLEASERAKLRREAEAANVSLDLKPCQKLTDYELRGGPAVKKP